MAEAPDLRLRERKLPEFAQFKGEGIYRYKNNPVKITFAESVQDPEKFPFPTESGRIKLHSPKVARTKYQDDFPPIPCYVPPSEGWLDPLMAKYLFQLIGWHTKRRCHSIHDNNPALEKLDPQRLWMVQIPTAPSMFWHPRIQLPMPAAMPSIRAWLKCPRRAAKLETKPRRVSESINPVTFDAQKYLIC